MYILPPGCHCHVTHVLEGEGGSGSLSTTVNDTTECPTLHEAEDTFVPHMPVSAGWVERDYSASVVDPPVYPAPVPPGKQWY